LQSARREENAGYRVDSDQLRIPHHFALISNSFAAHPGHPGYPDATGAAITARHPDTITIVSNSFAAHPGHPGYPHTARAAIITRHPDTITLVSNSFAAHPGHPGYPAATGAILSPGLKKIQTFVKQQQYHTVTVALFLDF
jgi:hypothetical protein